ncbi:transposase, partial [Leptospira borgpetersenii serovar Hardjo-bovis]|nr:transposase [Leptospira borgpetersenii serovar Hardjo-bovis]MBE8362290.1 transposase [Leptospira borgpetersenii serovar Hardjo-bovis]MBE8371918.1 transposase [Leptospira borgpetersenii serovar Hardjo-bovis]MBE8378092.1 transposase [Leptospira borgpetersenii serovar Hardjo-bovis]MBF3313505.1 transposase [Leptospira borgpetersenii serovar Hardjo-bovis]
EAIVSLYGKRWNIETHFRFEKYSLEVGAALPRHCH